MPSWLTEARIESSSLSQEVSGLLALEYEMSRNLELLKQRQADAKFSKTLAGRLFNWGGRLFALYCIYRILNVSIPLSSTIPTSTHGRGSRSST